MPATPLPSALETQHLVVGEGIEPADAAAVNAGLDALESGDRHVLTTNMLLPDCVASSLP